MLVSKMSQYQSPFVWSLSLYMGPRARASLPMYKKSDARYDIYALRYTLFWRKWLMMLATIEGLRYTFFWLKCFLNDGGSLTLRIVGNRGVSVYLFWLKRFLK